jgi:hypothetical protein
MPEAEVPAEQAKSTDPGAIARNPLKVARDIALFATYVPLL